MNQNHIALCYTALFYDASTRIALRDIFLPRMRKELEGLRACRAECESRPDWIDHWRGAGMINDEATLAAAIAHADSAISEHGEASA